MKILGCFLLLVIFFGYNNRTYSPSDTVLDLVYHSKFLDATPILEKIIEKDSTNYVARELLARCYYETADYDKAIQVLTNSLRRSCDSAYIYFWLAVNEARVGRRNHSLAYLEQSISVGFINRELIVKNESFLSFVGNGQLIYLFGLMKKEKKETTITAYNQLADFMEGYWTITNDHAEEVGLSLIDKFNPPLQFHEIRSINGELEKIVHHYDAENQKWTQYHFMMGRVYRYEETGATQKAYPFILKKKIETIGDKVEELKEINKVSKNQWVEITYANNKKNKLRTLLYTKK